MTSYLYIAEFETSSSKRPVGERVLVLKELKMVYLFGDKIRLGTASLPSEEARLGGFRAFSSFNTRDVSGKKTRSKESGAGTLMWLFVNSIAFSDS